MKHLCPEFQCYLVNTSTYRKPSRFYQWGKNQIILSNEDCTQGDNTAMSMYACSTKPLINRLKNPDLNPGGETAKQVWFADDSCAAGKFTAVLAWWKELQKIGPGYRYFPKLKKSVLVVKTGKKFEEARNLFDSLRITLEGSRYLGRVIGSESFKEVYVKKKVDEGINDIKQIS